MASEGVTAPVASGGADDAGPSDTGVAPSEGSASRPVKKAKTTTESMRGDLNQSELPSALVVNVDSDAEDADCEEDCGSRPTDDPETEGRERVNCIGCNKMKFMDSCQKFPSSKGSTAMVYRCNCCNNAKSRINTWLGNRASQEEIQAYNNLGAAGRKLFAAQCHKVMGSQLPMALSSYIEQKATTEISRQVEEKGEMVSSETLENYYKDLLFNRNLKYVYIYVYSI